MSNHILPILRIQGEPKATYRRMIGALEEAGVRSFCVESAAHKEFCRDEWWHDMDCILDEAAKRNMRVWIMDDQHYPTGDADGGMDHALLSQHRWNIYHHTFQVKPEGTLKLKISKNIHPSKELQSSDFDKNGKNDELIAVSAIGFLPTGQKKIMNLSSFVLDDTLVWKAPEGAWTVEICGASLNTGSHCDYINLLNRSSCRIQLDQVYEPHYVHYSGYFGNVIAGFYSNDPALGNFREKSRVNSLGTEQDLPYSDELEELLTEKLGAGWKSRLPLLWRNDYDPAETAHMRYAYMDAVSHLAQEDYSHQIGNWCREHGVEYIGHTVTDNNQHARTGNSLGHYFRGMKWQNMAGISDEGGQVYPQGVDKKYRCGANISDGEFCHYTLGKLGASLAALNPNMAGNSFCDIFGGYGWSEGVRLQKYLVDHFMVRGINHFAPKAFSCRLAYESGLAPEPYVQGHHPQFRHFGKLMEYTERVCRMISGGYAETPFAVLYHAEGEWTGKFMPMQKVARILYDNQADYLFVPVDAFAEPEFYGTRLGRHLTVNGHEFKELIIPYTQFITKETAAAIAELRASGCKIAFMEALPDGICNGEEAKLLLPAEVASCNVMSAEDLAEEARKLREAVLAPECSELRIMHYFGDLEFYYLFNESDKPYEGTIAIPGQQSVYAYNAWLDRNEKLMVKDGAATINLAPSESIFIMCGAASDCVVTEKEHIALVRENGTVRRIETVKLCKCTAKEYPSFSADVEYKTKNGKFPSFAESTAFGGVKENSAFSGILQYRFPLDYVAGEAYLEITEASEGVEVFVDGVSLGIQLVPGFLYNLAPLLRKGRNEIAIEVATTLEREMVSRGGKSAVEGAPSGMPTGITGEVNLYLTEE